MKITSAALLAVIGVSFHLPQGVSGFSSSASNGDGYGSRSMSTRSMARCLPLASKTKMSFALHMSSSTPPVLPTINVETAPPEQIEALVRSEYQLWLDKFGKARNEARYPTFKTNYLLQLQYDQQTGVYCGLNEFGDLTPEEYEAMTARPAEAPVPAEAVTDEDVDAKIRSEYQAWAAEYARPMSSDRYAIFKQNFLANMKYYEQTGKYYVLNEYADMTPEEFTEVRQQQEPTTSNPSDLQSGANYMDSLGGGANTFGKEASYMPTKYRDTAGTGMPSYFDSLNSSSPASDAGSGTGMPSYFNGAGTTPPPAAYTTPTPLTPAGPAAVSSSSGAGTGLPSYTNALSGGTSGTMKPASYMPKSYKQSSGSGMPSYFDNLANASSSSYSSPPSSVSTNPAAAAATPVSGAGLPSYTDALSGGSSAKVKQSSYMPKSYKPTSGSGMSSYFDSMGSGATSSSYTAPTAPTTNNVPPTASGTGVGAGIPSYTAALSGTSTGKMKESSFMPKSYKQSSGSGMPSYFDSMGKSDGASASYVPPPAPPTTETSYSPPAMSTSSTSETGLPSYTAALSGGESAKMKQSSYMPKSYKQSSGSGMPSYFDSMSGGGTKPTSSSSGAGLPSYTDALSGGGGGGPKMKQSSYMPKSYKQPSGAGMSSYLDNMGSAWSPPQVETKAPTPDIRPNIAPQTQAPPPPQNIRTNIAPPHGMKADQAAQLARIASPPRGPSVSHLLTNPMTRPEPLKCDQTVIMREGEAFLPHAQDPVIKRGNLEPDQSSAMRYFFTGRLCATEPFRPIPMKARFPSDQERADNQTRRSLMYFQQATRNVRRNPPDN